MRHVAGGLWIASFLLVCGAGCIPKAATEIRTIQIAVDPVDTCRIDQDDPVRLQGLQPVLQERRRQIKQSRVEPSEFTVRISVDDAAPYSNFIQVVEACRASGFFKLELGVAQLVFPLDLTPQRPSGAPDELQLPPLELRLQAAENGELTTLMLNDRTLASLEQLRLEIIGLIGDERGLGSI